MPSMSMLIVFLGTAIVLAIMPGPGVLYIAGRTLGSGRQDGFASCAGTALGGSLHVFAGAIGVSALIMASAEAFFALKMIGGVYLIYLGIQAWRSAGKNIQTNFAQNDRNLRAAFRQGAFVEATNPKTAAFFLALIPQFIDATRAVTTQFIVLGSISIIVNTLNALIVVWIVSKLRERVLTRTGLVARLQKASGALLGSLGLWLLLSRRPA